MGIQAHPSLQTDGTHFGSGGTQPPNKPTSAVYLRERGYPAAVILDDALVHADDHRFERMQTALRKAGETIQVLILTCRQRDWSNFGAPIRRLADGKVM
jgi:hypothetical protein